MLLPPFFWQDLCNSSKEMFVEHFITHNKWTNRLRDYVRVVISMGIIVMCERYTPMMPVITQLRHQKNESPFQPLPILWLWLLLTVIVCVSAESMSILDCVFNKMKQRHRERLVLKCYSSKHALAA